MTTAAPAIQPLLNFVHIPKTGGTSLRAFVEQQYPEERISAASAARGSGGAFGGELAEKWLFAGHLNITGLLPEAYARFTVMREPVARLRSQFNHWVAWSAAEIDNSPSPPEIKALKHRAKSSTLEEFLALEGTPIFRLFDNGQCKTLVSNYPVPEQREYRGGALARRACEALDAMRVVGLTERMEGTVHLLCHALGWPPPPRVERLNMRARDRHRDAEAMPAVVERAVEWDREAYAHAAERFERDHAAMLDDLGAADEDGVVAALDERARLALVESGLERADEVRLGAAGGIRGVGWHELERTRRGHAYRWTGPTPRSTIDLLVRPAERYEVAVGVVSLLHRDLLKGARVLVNGREADVRVKARAPFGSGDPAVYRLRAVVRGHPVGDDGFCRVELVVPRTWRHEDIEPGCGDTRQKGLAVSGVEIRPA